MRAPPTFATGQEYRARLGDLDFWWPTIAEVLHRHRMAETGRTPVPGVGSTYPTFLYGELVVKLFGFLGSWRQSHEAERSAHALLVSDPAIATPELLAEGRLSDDPRAPWPYLITSRMPGIQWPDAHLSSEQKLTVAADLGRQVHRVHVLAPSGVDMHEGRAVPDVVAAAEHSSLPAHLILQIDDYLAGLGPFDRVFVHGDLFERHVFVEGGRLAGIIDWGDATVTDRHYELAKLHLGTFQCDKSLLRAFLDASDWPVGTDFPRQALGLALHQQARGLALHLTMDTFHNLPARLGDIATLDELADELFAV